MRERQPTALNAMQRGDALVQLRSLKESCSPLVFFDPQHRTALDRLSYGNEGLERQKARAALPAMSAEYIDACCHESMRVLQPSGYLMRWIDVFGLCTGQHLRIIGETCQCVDLIAWDSLRVGMGYRSRRRGDYLLIFQKPPIKAKSTWRDHGIPDRWPEKVDRRVHPHRKPLRLTVRLIGAVTRPGDLVIDPAAGSFTVMHAAHQLGRDFVGCDLRLPEDGPVAVAEPGDAAQARFLW
jgi:site-specific DNA-methyltransferase (adenine-specific)